MENMWLYVSIALMVCLTWVVFRYEVRERKWQHTFRGNKAAMMHLRSERRLSDNETPVPGQGKML